MLRTEGLKPEQPLFRVIIPQRRYSLSEQYHTKEEGQHYVTIDVGPSSLS